MSSLSAEPWEGIDIIVALFEIPANSYPKFLEREREFEIALVEPFSIDDNDDGDQSLGILASICRTANDDHYKQVMFVIYLNNQNIINIYQYFD